MQFYLATYAFPDEVKELDAYSVALGNGKLFRNQEEAVDWASDMVEEWYVANGDYHEGYSSDLNMEKSNFRDTEFYDFTAPDGKVFAVVCVRIIIVTN